MNRRHDLFVPADETPMFEPLARDFEQHAATSAYNALYDRPATLELCGDVRDLRVFDAGCGPGLYAEELIARGAREVEGVDASVTMVALARNGSGIARRSESMTSRSR